ncbi:hypothetical protein [Amantichitinum ursilacus]|uniref:Uncharacterized protein n=1 Tax=Amantichitinum ursilacus TaxID=857265 RepID=A0A0N1JSP5_9NEIS|nr:hypothetical protein [Amantichitinum ursilacus]KPC52609.1 hypothetical protein WG78_12215 [Amantichitinum ursilacus]
MSWYIPPLTAQALPEPPGGRHWAIGLVAVLGTATMLTLLFWPGGASRRVPLFWVCAVAIPALVWALVFLTRVAVYMLNRSWVLAANDGMHAELTRWHGWARSRMAVLACCSVTPEPDLIARLTGRMGSAPFNPGRALRLQQLTDDDRQAQLVGMLIEQILPALKQLQGPVAVLVLPTEHGALPDVAHAINAAWHNARIAAAAEITLLTEWPGPPETWPPATKTTPYLLLGLQLAAPRKSTALTESGFALLLGSAQAAQAQGLLPAAWLYRAMPLECASVEGDLAELLHIQRPSQPVQALWSSNLPQALHNSLMVAAQAHALDLQPRAGFASVCVLEKVLGPCGDAGPWLALVLAVEALRAANQSGLLATARATGDAFLQLIEPTHHA